MFERQSRILLACAAVLALVLVAVNAPRAYPIVRDLLIAPRAGV